MEVLWTLVFPVAAFIGVTTALLTAKNNARLWILIINLAIFGLAGWVGNLIGQPVFQVLGLAAATAVWGLLVGLYVSNWRGWSYRLWKWEAESPFTGITGRSYQPPTGQLRSFGIVVAVWSCFNAVVLVTVTLVSLF